jgi:hypothetical protein
MSSAYSFPLPCGRRPHVQASEFRADDRIAPNPDGPCDADRGPPIRGHAVASKHLFNPSRGITPVANERSADVDVVVEAETVDPGIEPLCVVS